MAMINAYKKCLCCGRKYQAAAQREKCLCGGYLYLVGAVYQPATKSLYLEDKLSPSLAGTVHQPTTPKGEKRNAT